MDDITLAISKQDCCRLKRKVKAHRHNYRLVIRASVLVLLDDVTMKYTKISLKITERMPSSVMVLLYTRWTIRLQ